MKLLVGAPVFKRDWIIQHWFDHLSPTIPCDWGMVLVGDYFDPTTMMMESNCRSAGIPFKLVEVDENLDVDAKRDWTNKDNIRKMVILRNLLLEEVRRQSPDYFLSLDSDILVTETTVPNMIDTIQNDERNFNAVGGRCYMGSGKAIPSWYNTFCEGKRTSRRDSLGVFGVDVIMAIKLMDPGAYNVDYEYHRYGEDVGWSLACRERGLNLGVDARDICKHVMQPEHLNRYDKRCGF